MTTPEVSVRVDGPLIIGDGIAGLVAALANTRPCTLITAGTFGATSATRLAQGGMAAAVSATDSPQQHASDTLAAGVGRNDPDAVDVLTRSAADAVRWLGEHGVRFDRTDAGFALGLEGAHSVPRILHCGEDTTGARLSDALVQAVRRCDRITVREHTVVTRLLTDADGSVCGVQGVTAPHTVRPHEAVQLWGGDVVLATGGYAALFAHTTNPRGSWGSALALAARVGARLRDVDLVQFHPTALAVDVDPAPLISEAVRGAGAQLVDARGHRIMTDPLAARDVVARALSAQWAAQRPVFLDTPTALGSRFAERFPSIYRSCLAHGFDPTSDLIPVRPAAHYSMGGIHVDLDGRTSIPGLWAVGECASTGVHGANRLASNSLLEAVVFGRRTARCLSMSGQRPGRRNTPLPVPDAPRPTEPAPQLRADMTRWLGVLRDRSEVARAAERWTSRAVTDDAYLVASLVARSALERTESVGAHQWRHDAQPDAQNAAGPFPLQAIPSLLAARSPESPELSVPAVRIPS